MKKWIVFLLVLTIGVFFLPTERVLGDSYDGTVEIYFEKEIPGSVPKETEKPNRDVIKETNRPKEISKLPQLGQMITSVIVLLIGIIVTLTITMFYLVKKVNEYKKLGGY